MTMGYRRLFRIGQAPVEREIDEEIASHIEIRTEQLIRAGETPERAREIALARFGDLEQARKDLYATSKQSRSRLGRTETLRAITRDARLVWRQSARAPLATALTLVTLALAIGLTTAMFAIVDHVLIRPLPYAEPEQLVFFESVDSARHGIGVISSDDWLDMRARNRTLESTAIYKSFDASVMVEGVAHRVPLQLVTSQFFDVLRAPMVYGRGFVTNDAGPERAAVVSESFWRRHLYAARDGRVSITLQGSTYNVIGAVKAGAEYPRNTQVWIPEEPRLNGGASRNNVNYEAIARVRPVTSIDAVQSDLSTIALAIQAAEPVSRYTHGVKVQPLQRYVVNGSTLYLRILMGAVAFVLLLACANIAGVNFARARSRQQEVSIRMALGAGRSRVMAQLLTEQVVLSMIGGAGGIALAWYIVYAIRARLADLLPRAGEIAIDTRVCAFALIVSLFAGLLSALAPTWRASGATPRELMGARGVAKGGRRTTGSAVVAIEIAAATVLLCGGALLLRSFGSLTSRDLGFDPDRVITAHVILDAPAFAPPLTSPEKIARFWDDLGTRVRALPDVESVTLATVIPTSTVGPGFIQVEGLDDRNAGAGYHVIDRAYFEALRIPLRAGRSFNDEDVRGALRGVVVNESFVAKYSLGRSPLGMRVRALSMEGYTGAEPAWLTVIGVAGDVRQWGYENPAEPEMYVYARDVPNSIHAMHIAARARTGREAAVSSAMQRIIRGMDSNLAPEIATMDEGLGGPLRERRLIMAVLTGFGVIGLLLSSIGIYALLAFAVAQRTREIGVRMALGSRPGEIVALILKSTARVVVIGAVAGLLMSFALTRLMQSLLVDVKHTDPLSYAGAALVLAFTAIVACVIPVRKAVRVDPLTALHTD